MMRLTVIISMIITMGIASCQQPFRNEGSLIRLEGLRFDSVDERFVDVWLPPDYQAFPEKHFPVLYMHDGQNLFNPETAYGGTEWGVDETITTLSIKGLIEPCIVVGIWNTPKRFAEYAPYLPFSMLSDSTKKNLMAEFGFNDEPYSLRYLRFIVHELKPNIDRQFRTIPDREHTFIMGSSMGGLISLYALCEFPQVFGGAGCISTHWPFRIKENNYEFTRAFMAYLEPRLHTLLYSKIYFDYGTENLDAWYEVNQKMVDTLFMSAGFDEQNYRSLKFEGHDHNEKSWRERLHIPLQFLLGK